MKKLNRILILSVLFVALAAVSHAGIEAPVLTKNMNGNDVSLSWTEISDATGYTLYYALYPAGDSMQELDLGNVTSLSFTLSSGDAFYVGIKSYDTQSSSGMSNVEVLAADDGTSAIGTQSLEHVTYLSTTIGKRVAGSQEEIAARDYIIGQFLAMGLSVSQQEFEYQSGDAFGISYNVIASIPGASDKEVILGAHYDSVDVGEGATDNASGIGVMLEAAKTLKDQALPFTVRFIAFGAEEISLKGSKYYAGQMTSAEIANTVAMINLDTVAGGDKIYVYGGEGDDGWIRDQALSIAQANNIPMETNPGLNPDYPVGTTGDWSDHAPFKALGLPYGYFESTNWEIGDLDGYVQTELYGEIWHTDNDTLAFYETNFPGMVAEQLSQMTETVTELLLTIDPPATLNFAAGEPVKPVPVQYTTRSGKPLD